MFAFCKTVLSCIGGHNNRVNCLKNSLHNFPMIDFERKPCAGAFAGGGGEGGRRIFYNIILCKS